MRTIIAALALAGVIVTSFTVSASAQDMRSWSQAVGKLLAEKQRYPRSAVSRGIEGRAEVKLTVSGSGEITAHEIQTPTGEKVLDREIPKLIERLNPLPGLPEGRSQLVFTLPINWRLQ